MKRILVAMASMIIAVLMCVTCLTGCNLVTTNNERDMNQLVATVKIDDTMTADNIYKKDMVISYLNYYYMYEQQGYTRPQIFKMIIDQLITSRVYVQNAMKTFDGAKDNAESIFHITLNDNKEKWDLERYLTADDIRDSQYSAYKDMNNLIDSYEEKDDDVKHGDTMPESVRPVPTGAKNNEEVTDAEKIEYINKGIDTTSTPERRKAYSKVIDVLKENDIWGDNQGTDIKDTTFYKETLDNYYEKLLIEKYDKCITDDARSKVTFDMVASEYALKYEEQTKFTSADFAKAVESVSSSAPILYSGFDGYGLVYNLLLKVDDSTKAELDDWKKENKNYTQEEYEAKRAELFNNIKVKDQRGSWLYNGYDFDFATKKFTGDYAHLEDSLPFKGEVKLLNDTANKDDKDYKAQYGIESYKEYNLEEFIKMMELYVYGTEPAGIITEFDGRVKDIKYGDGENDCKVADYDERIKELMFAFSGDDSDTALNTYKGYAITPEPDGSNTEKYMIEFAEAGRELLTLGDRSYVMVATDYGYHIMFYSQKFTKGEGYPTLISYLNANYGTKTDAEWKTFYDEMIKTWEDFEDTEHYLYILQNSLSQSISNSALEKERKKLLDAYVYQGDYVVKYEGAYKDLITK